MKTKVLGKGTRIDGSEVEFTSSNMSIFAVGNNLTKIEIYEGVTNVFLTHNFNLKEVNFPDSIQFVCCDGGLFDYTSRYFTALDVFYFK